MKVGAYDVVSEIGRGGAGVVLRGRNASGADVAIKVLNGPNARDGLPRFEREMRLLAQLGEDDGFVPLLERGESPQGPFLVMPFVPGGTLRSRIEKGPMPIPEVVELGRQLAIAVGRAHARGIVHRDLKPENVLFTAAGKPLLADLGLAKHFRRDVIDASQSISLSNAGEACGSSGYMAPEQVSNAKMVGPPADVFALGAILFECLTGKPAFEANSLAEMLAKVTLGDRKTVTEMRADVPPWLHGIVEKALAPEPADRYEDGRALSDAFVHADAGAQVQSRRQTLLAVVILLAGLTVAGGIFALKSGWLRPRKGDGAPVNSASVASGSR